MNKYWPYFKLYGLLGAMLTAVLIFNIVALFWVKRANADFLHQNEELTRLVAKRSNLSQIKQEHEKVIAGQEKIIRSFVAKDRLVEFIEFLENTAKNAGNSVEISSVGEAENGGVAKNFLNFRMGLTGSFPRFINFLAQLENAPYLISPGKIDVFETQDFETKTSIFKASLEIKVLSI